MALAYSQEKTLVWVLRFALHNHGFVAVLITLLLLASCQSSPANQVVVPQSDTTSPFAALDIYGVPRQPGASSDEPLISITASCCSITRKIAQQTTLTFIAGGKDEDGGVAYVAIDGGVNFACQDPATNLGSVGQSTLHQDFSDPAKPGGLAERTRNVTLQLRLDDLAKKCNTSQGEVLVEVRGTVKATTTNFHGGVDTTHTFTFEFP